MGIKVEPNPDLSRRQDLKLQLGIADKLLGFAATMTIEPRLIETVNPRRSYILMALGAKTFATFQCVQALLKLGMYEDSSALVRIMYESAMIATFLAHAADDQTVEDYADYFMFRNWRDHELALQVNSEAAKAFAPEVLLQMKADFDAVQGRYSGSSWTKLSSEAMAVKADDKLPTGFRVFEDLYAAIYRRASAFVHSDVRSIQEFFKEDAGGLSIQRPSTPERCANPMYAANFIMFAMCWVVAGSFYGAKFIPEWNALILEWNGTPDALGLP